MEEWIEPSLHKVHGNYYFVNIYLIFLGDRKGTNRTEEAVLFQNKKKKFYQNGSSWNGDGKLLPIIQTNLGKKNLSEIPSVFLNILLNSPYQTTFCLSTDIA